MREIKFRACYLPNKVTDDVISLTFTSQGMRV